LEYSRIDNQDLSYISSSLEDEIISKLRGTRIFITGGTGFFGKWLLESLLYLNKERQLNCSLVVLSRNPKSFLASYPYFDHPDIRFHSGDIKTFADCEGPFNYCIHAAAEVAALQQTSELDVLEASYEGTKRVLEFSKNKNVTSVLYVSSGAIYGRQPPELPRTSEKYKGSPDIGLLNASYGEGKRLAEYLCNYYSDKHKLSIKIARCFAFIGPHLPLDSHFACGNFILNGL